MPSTVLSHIFPCLESWIKHGLLDWAVSHSHHINKFRSSEKAHPESTLPLVLQGFILPTPQGCLNSGYEQAQSHINALLEVSRHEKHMPSYTHKNIHFHASASARGVGGNSFPANTVQKKTITLCKRGGLRGGFVTPTGTGSSHSWKPP